MRILITGGAGSLGTALCRHWYSKHDLTVLSRDPHKQARLTAEMPGIRFILADICNEGEVRRACEGQDVLVHAAALKDVGTGEFHPSEFIRVNVLGSETVVQQWHTTHPANSGKVLLVSTDKAASPINAYGKSKGLAEAIFRKYDYSAIRYGNVIESVGSFIHKWKAAIAEGKPIRVREPEPTRFLLRMSEAIALIEDALDLIDKGSSGIFVPHSLKAFSVWQAAAALKVPVEYEPLLPYEKKHEQLVAEGEIPVWESELLSRIKPGWSYDYLGFRSDNVDRLTGREVLEVLGWQQ